MTSTGGIVTGGERRPGLHGGGGHSEGAVEHLYQLCRRERVLGDPEGPAQERAGPLYTRSSQNAPSRRWCKTTNRGFLGPLLPISQTSVWSLSRIFRQSLGH